MKCGHVRAEVGTTQPVEELERRGLVNQKFKPDPRYLAKVKQEWLAFFAKRKEAKMRGDNAELYTSHYAIH